MNVSKRRDTKCYLCLVYSEITCFDHPVKRVQNPQNTLMRTDVKETEKCYELDVELPGVKKEDVKAQLKDGYLTISAETKFDNSDEHEGKYIRRERYYGTSSRSFYVGDELTEEDIKAKFEDGILKISVPKKQSEEKIETPKFIQIEG